MPREYQAPELPDQVVTAATALLEAKRAFRKAWVDFQATLQPLPPDCFWRLVDRLKAEIQTFYFGYKRTNGIEQAAHELFRKALVGESDYTLAECYGFLASYRDTDTKLGRRLARLFDFCGDSFGDLMDSLPLAGRRICEELRFETEADLSAALKTLPAEWRKLIHGENYVLMSLETAARHFLMTVVSDRVRAEVEV